MPRGKPRRGGSLKSRGSARNSFRPARSGIRTKSGAYRKFDSQRVKNVQSESEASEPESEGKDEEVEEAEEEEAVPVRVSAYSKLLQSLGQDDSEEEERPPKRMKLDDEHDDIPEMDPDGADEEDGEEGHASSDEEDESDPYEVHLNPTTDTPVALDLKTATKSYRNIPKIGTLQIYTHPDLSPLHAIHRLDDLRLKKKISSKSLAPQIFNYSDLLFTRRTPTNAPELRSILTLHALNHLLKGRDKVLKHNSQDDPPADQGFTRPRVLILTETRNLAYQYGLTLTRYFSPEQIENRSRFKDSFYSPPPSSPSQPEDYTDLFSGNSDNTFTLGVKLTRKTLRYFSSFYQADLILASPLGLKKILQGKKRDSDFLSSIEILILDQADAMGLQSWDNVTSVFSKLNKIPEESHDADLNRVRSVYLDGHGSTLRQTIILSAYTTPEILSAFRSCENWAARALVRPIYPPIQLPEGITISFERFLAIKPTDVPDKRFEYFTQTALPEDGVKNPSQQSKGVLIFLASYFDFLRLRNYLLSSTTISFGSIHDYSSPSEQRSTKALFRAGRFDVLLYTQRAHHFWRLRIRGVKRVFCYGVPENPNFWAEVVGMNCGYKGGGGAGGEG
ncbi:DUF1253-domain-containing protein [Piedraia hortae CBS 480.64]|uniref:U3 small nucleolar RNA-associated protein 25 n=1 Tax=Piedraia hortae CBS 480.64 TaxID=1314780 RepID=A0A6A7CAV7_9PEZI|nr:DUF1253-domain-containing protein [Piedraia hortae CBS 480.64]